MGIKKNIIAPLFLFVSLFFLFSYRLYLSFDFHPDFARDIYDILSIVQGKLTLIGPKLSFGGIYSGPYYYYLFAPVLYLTNLNLNSLLVFNLILFILGLVLFYSILIRYLKSIPIIYSLLVTLTIALLPVYITSSRGPWNGSTFLPFLLFYLGLVYFYDFTGKKAVLLLTGFLGGVIVSIHLVNIPVILISAVYLLIFLKKRSEILYFLAGLFAAFIPMVLFEIKHDFVMIKNTFLVGSYKTFVENNNIPGAVSGKKDIIENLIFLSGKLSQQLGVNIVFYFLTSLFLFFKTKSAKEKILLFSSLLLILFFAVVLRYQFGSHYLFPITLFVAFALSTVLIKSKYRWLIGLILVLELFSFPKNIYTESARKFKTFESRVEFVIDSGLIKKSESFNIIQISKDYKAYIPVGHEYRYFFKKNNYFPRTEFEYNASDTLLIFSEIKDFDIIKLDNWEAREFGKENLLNHKVYKTNDALLYVIKK